MKSAGGLVVAVTLAIGGNAYANPAWCPSTELEQGNVDTILNAKKNGSTLGAVVSEVVKLSCARDNLATPQTRDVARQAYEKISARLQMTDDDWRDAVEWMQTNYAAQAQLDLRPTNQSAVWSTLDPIEQFAMIMHPNLTGAHGGGQPDTAYAVDVFGPALSQIGRLAYAELCVGSKQPVEWAMCQGDLDALDAKQLYAELRADKAHSGYARMTIRLVYDKVSAQIAQRAEDVKQLIAKDSAYRKLFDIASAQRRDWDARWKANPPALEMSRQMDDAMASASRKAADGCHDKSWDALATAIGHIPAASFATARVKDKDYEFVDDVVATVTGALLTDPEGYLALSAYVTCRNLAPLASAPDGDPLSNAVTGALARFPGMRGPRTSTQSAILTAKIQLDDRNAQLEQPMYQRFWFSFGSGSAGGIDGTVASVKSDAKHATITFDQKLEQEVVDTGCTQSNRIHSIRSNGTLEYEVNCTGTKTVSVDKRPKPKEVLLRYAAGLQAGMPVAIRANVVFAAWPARKAKAPSRVLGVAVK